MQGKRNYKDSLFRNIFKDKKRLCSLYNALSGENISPRDITINTLRGTFYNDVKNDISFKVGNHTVVLMEHQGSYNVPKSVDTLRRRDFQKVNCR